MENNSKWVDPTPIAIFLVGGILLGCFWPMLVGFLSPAAAPLIAGVLLASSVVFIILMVVEIRSGNLFGATLNGVFGVLLGLAPGMIFLFQFLAQAAGIEVDGRITGWYFFYVSLVLIVVGIAAGRMFWHMALAFWVLAVDIFLIALVFAGFLSHTIEPVLGWVIFAGGVYFLYMATAAFLGAMLQRPVLPVGKPLYPK